jgi:hypothetical protein
MVQLAVAITIDKTVHKRFKSARGSEPICISEHTDSPDFKMRAKAIAGAFRA